jgi:type IV secretory pathway TrbF-like protein
MRPETALETPYLRARQEWDERMGLTLLHAKNWRLAFFGTGALTIILTFGLIALAVQRKVETFVVGVDPMRGEATVLGRADTFRYAPQMTEVRYFLSELIKLVRSVSSDPVILKGNWLKAYKFLTPEAATMLNQTTAKEMEEIVKRVGDRTVVVQPISVIQVPNSSSYQVRWKETVFGRRGEMTEEYVMNGIFSVTVAPPANEAELLENPLGIFIKSFEWSREINADLKAVR